MKNQLLLRALLTAFILLLFTGSFCQLSIPDTNPVTINFTGFTGTGLAPSPAAGQLDSDDWLVTGCSDNMTPSFGSTLTTLDFANGSSTGNVTGGGVYAFDVGSSNITLGVQPTGADWSPGSFILRIQNNTGGIIGTLDVSYSIFVRNDQARGNSFNFSHSSDNTTYTLESALDYTSPAALDALGWIEVTRNITLTGVNINPLEMYYLRWSGDDVSGSGSRDEFGLDKVSVTATLGWIDIMPPVFNLNTPRADDIRLTQFDIVVNLDEIGTVYYLVKNNGDPAPTLAEVRNGDTLDVFTANSDFSTTINGLTLGTSYDVYFLAEDDETVPNVQNTTTLLAVTTKVPRTLDLVAPVGGETFFVGDTTTIRWTSDGIDSIQLRVWDFETHVWHSVLGDDNAKLYAEQDTFVLIIPRNAGLDSTYFRILDAADPNYFDSCGIFYLTDTIKPSVAATLPANLKTNVGQIDSVILAFDERIFQADGSILIRRKPDQSIFASIPVATGNLSYYYNYVVVHLDKLLETGTEYYITITPGSFIDYQDNEFAGILDDTTWTFTTIGQDLYISEYIEGSSNNKAIEIANTTGSDVDLSQYEIWRANSVPSTGGVVNWNVVNRYSLSGSLPNNSVYVICNANAMDSIKVRSDLVGGATDGATWYNGDDAVAIAKMVDGNWILIDAVGIEGPDPGTAWSVAGVANATAEHTLLRKSYVKDGNIDWPMTSGSNAFDSEWKVFPQNYYENLGIFTQQEDTLAEIISFTLAEQKEPATIDSAAATIDVVAVLGTSLDSLFPIIVVSPGAGVMPASGDSVDFSKGSVLYTVTAQDHVHTKVWTVTVTVEIIPSSENDILSFTLAEQSGNAVIDIFNHVISAEVLYGTSLVSLVPSITVSAAAAIDPLSGVARDFSDTLSYTVTAQDGTPQVWKVAVKVKQPVEVSTVAELRAGLQDGTLYKLTGEVILTAQFSLRNQKYIQDATAGIEIDDYSGKFTTAYNIGDGITGILGKIIDYRGMLEFTPEEDPGAATSTGNPIVPIDLTVGEFLENTEMYESRIIRFTRVAFVDAGNTFQNGKNYNLIQESDTAIFRTQYYDLDYTGTVIPSLANVTAIGYEYYSTPEIVSRSLADIVEVILSSEKDILTFVLTQQTGDAVINTTNHTVGIEVLSGTNITALAPVITLSSGATITPESGTPADFTNPVTYTVTAEDGSSQDWTVTVTLATSVPDNILDGKVRIWPNPNNGIFYLTLISEQITDVTLQVLDMDGRMVYNKEYSSVNVINDMTDTGISEQGIYIVRIMSGTSTWTGKLVIQ